MTILYAQIQSARDSQLLTGTISTHGSYTTLSSSIFSELQDTISKVPSKDSKFYTFRCTDNKNKFFIKTDYQFIYSVITDITNSDSTVYNYISNIETLFTKEYSPNKTNYSYFNESIKKSTDRFNQDQNYMELGADLKKTKEKYAESLNLLLQRGENLKTINMLAEKLKFASEELKVSSRSMYLDTFVSKYKMYVVILVVVFLFFYFLFKK